MLTASQWKTKTFAAGKSRSPQLGAVDQALAAYGINPSQHNLSLLCTAIENWSNSKAKPGGAGGYAEIIGGTRDRSGAVQELVTDVRQIAGKPAHWPDATAGSAYVVTLNQTERDLLRDMRSAAAMKSVSMIAAMDVDWTSFAFDQIGNAGSLAIDLGHTDYSGTWDAAQSNKTSIGQMEATAAGKIFNKILIAAGEELNADERVENVLRAAGLGTQFVLGVVKYYLFKEGVMSKSVPFFGQAKDMVDAIATNSVDLRLEQKSFRRVGAAKTLIMPNSDMATAINSFDTLLKIETSKTAADLSYRLLKNTALIITNFFTMGATATISIVTAIVEVVVAFVYQLVYSLVFQSSVKQCREWVEGNAAPEDLDFRGWSASCPLLGAYFIIGTAAGGGAATALSMFGQTGVAINSTDFQGASVKLERVRQSAAAFIQRSPVDVKWSGPGGEKFKWIDGLIANDALSASVGANFMKVGQNTSKSGVGTDPRDPSKKIVFEGTGEKMHYILTDEASRGDRARHRFYEHGNKAWSLAKKAWSVV